MTSNFFRTTGKTGKRFAWSLGPRVSFHAWEWVLTRSGRRARPNHALSVPPTARPQSLCSSRKSHRLPLSSPRAHAHARERRPARGDPNPVAVIMAMESSGIHPALTHTHLHRAHARARGTHRVPTPRGDHGDGACSRGARATPTTFSRAQSARAVALTNPTGRLARATSKSTASATLA
jgi:hypothetical protein